MDLSISFYDPNLILGHPILRTNQLGYLLNHEIAHDLNRGL